MKLINWELLSHPMNWIIVALMLIIGTAALHLIMHPGGPTVPHNM